MNPSSNDFTFDHHHFITLANLMEQHFLEKEEDKVRFVVFLNQRTEKKMEQHLSSEPKRIYVEMIQELIDEFHLDVLTISDLLHQLLNIKRGDKESEDCFIQRIRNILYQVDKECQPLTKKNSAELRSFLERLAEEAFLKGFYEQTAMSEKQLIWYLEKCEFIASKDNNFIGCSFLPDSREECRHWGHVYCSQCLVLRKNNFNNN